jgi:hypothetical protein
VTDIEQVATRSTLDVLMQGDDEKFVDWTDDLQVDELVDVGLALTTMTRVSTLRAGYVAYQIRAKTPDGEWGQMKWHLSETWDVSERTVQRWMAAAQSHYGFELTPAQRNAQAPPRADDASDEGPALEDVDHPWDADDEDAGFGDLAGYTYRSDDDSIDNRNRFNEVMGDVGWGDDTLPSADYVSPPESERRGPRMPALEPDPTWIEFTAAQIQIEHPAYEDHAAARTARARWDRKIESEPIELLEELEQIYEASGRELPAEVTVTLLEAAEAAENVVVPDEVQPPKKKRGGGSGSSGRVGTADPSDGPKNVERGMVYARSLAEHLTALTSEGGPEAVAEWYGASTAELAAWRYAVDNLLTRVKQAKEAVKRREAGEPETPTF